MVQISHRYGMILFIASEVMFFVAWFWAYFNAALFPADPHMVARTELLGGVWPPKGIETFDPWHLPLLNTLILLTSGTTVTWAHHALLENDREGLKWGLILTIVLGALFTGVQAYEYSHAAFNFSGNIYGATFFMATGFHGAHVLIGTIFLIVCLIRAYLGHFTPSSISASSSPPGTGTSSTWCGCSCSPASMSGARAAPMAASGALAAQRGCRDLQGAVARPPLSLAGEMLRLSCAWRSTTHSLREADPARPCRPLPALRQGRAVRRDSSRSRRAASTAGSISPSPIPPTARRSS